MSNQDNRKHQRISIQNEYEKASVLSGAAFQLEGQNPIKVLDMSAAGAACESFDGAKPGELLQAKVVLGDTEPQDLGLRVIWVTDSVVGVRFEDCDAAVKMSIEDFLQDRMVGQHMIAVDPKYFAEHVDFQSWYHGPNTTNVFVWRKSSDAKILKLMVSFEGQSLVFEMGELKTAGESVPWEEDATYSVEVLPRKGSSSEELPVLLDKEAPLVKRAIEVLSHLPFEQESILKVLQQMDLK